LDGIWAKFLERITIMSEVKYVLVCSVSWTEIRYTNHSKWNETWLTTFFRSKNKLVNVIKQWHMYFWLNIEFNGQTRYLF
jgi:hypothetical protein